MKRVLLAMGVCMILLGVASFLTAKEKKAKAGPLTGTWECNSDYRWRTNPQSRPTRDYQDLQGRRRRAHTTEQQRNLPSARS